MVPTGPSGHYAAALMANFQQQGITAERTLSRLTFDRRDTPPKGKVLNATKCPILTALLACMLCNALFRLILGAQVPPLQTLKLTLRHAVHANAVCHLQNLRIWWSKQTLRPGVTVAHRDVRVRVGRRRVADEH